MPTSFGANATRERIKRVVATRLLVMRKDAATPSIHVLDGRHPIVDVSLRAKGGGISFDPSYCDRTSIT